MYEWHFKKFLEVCAREKLLFMCKANTADEILRVLLFGSAWFSFLVSVQAREQKKTVWFVYEMRTQSRTHSDQWQTFPCSQRSFSSIKNCLKWNAGIWYTLQCKKLNSEIREVRNAATGQITFLKIILNTEKPTDLSWVWSRKEKGNLTRFQHNCYESHNYWVAVLYLLTFSFEVCCFHFRREERFGFLKAWCKKTHFLSLQIWGSKAQGGTTTEQMSTGSKCRTREDGCELGAS